MGYIVMKLYSFACDRPGCPMTYDYLPGPGGRLFDDALGALRADGWAVQGHAGARLFFCPEHK